MGVGLRSRTDLGQSNFKSEMFAAENTPTGTARRRTTPVPRPTEATLTGISAQHPPPRPTRPARKTLNQAGCQRAKAQAASASRIQTVRVRCILLSCQWNADARPRAGFRAGSSIELQRSGIRYWAGSSIELQSSVPVTNPKSSRELTRARAAPVHPRDRAHASSSCCCIHAIAVAHSVDEKVDGSSLCASRGRPRSWITCAIRRHQTSSEVIRGHQRPSGAIRRNQTQSEVITTVPSSSLSRSKAWTIRRTQRSSEVIRGHHLRALELAISLKSVDKPCPPNNPIARMEHNAFSSWRECAPMTRRLERGAPWR